MAAAKGLSTEAQQELAELKAIKAKADEPSPPRPVSRHQQFHTGYDYQREQVSSEVEVGGQVCPPPLPPPPNSPPGPNTRLWQSPLALDRHP